MRRVEGSLVAVIVLGSIFVVSGAYLVRLDAQSPLAPVLGWMLLAVGAGGALGAWRLSRQCCLLIALTMAATLAGFYLADLGLYLLPEHIEQRPAYTPTHDHRTKRQVVGDLRAANDKSAVPMVYPSFAVHFPEFLPPELKPSFGHTVLPLGGIANSTTVLCNESGTWAVYRSDEHGFNNRHGTWSHPVEVAVVGDSFSHGNCVQPEEGWVWRLQPYFAGVLNLAVGGNGPLFELASLREYLPRQRPRIVLWQYFEGHDTRVPGEKALPILGRYLEQPGFTQSLIGRQPEIDRVLGSIVERALAEPESKLTSRTFSLRDFLLLNRLRHTLGMIKRPPLDDVTTILAAAKTTVESWGGHLYFVYLPSWYGLRSRTTPVHYASHDRVIEAVRSLGIEVIDLDPVFRGHPDPFNLFPYRENYHYNALGYALVADTVLRSLGRVSQAKAATQPSSHAVPATQ
jgi:hypothetical protein